LSHPKRRLPIIMYPSQSAGVSSGVMAPDRSAAVETTTLKVDPGGYTPFSALLVQAFRSSMSAAAATVSLGENTFRSYDGRLAIASTSPVRTSSATAAPVWSPIASSAACWRSMSRLVVRVRPWTGSLCSIGGFTL
jgi:hypothetical protein